MSTAIKIKNLKEGFQSIITNGKHSIIGDEPLTSNGTDLGLAPTELVISGLALCKVATIRNYAKSKNWEIGEVHAELSLEVGRGDKGLQSNVKIKIDIEGDITEEQKTALLKQADNCFIHRMIMGNWNIEHATDL